VTISGYGGTSGSYRLTMMPGYTRSLPISAQDRWQAANSALTVEPSADGIGMILQNVTETTALAYNTSLAPLSDFYLQARVQSVGNNNDGWIVAAALRRIGNTYYLLEFNHLGRWRFSAVSNGTQRVVRDWT
ncbi:MAG: hypothetical protein CUN53_20770, partial [Phototrophicales bacterium]